MQRPIAIFLIILSVLSARSKLSFAERPNVVYILCDDLRADCLGIAGHPHLKTPNIDRLAHEGIYFKNMFCTTSLCSPSRATILSGQYAHGHKVLNNFTEYPTELPSLPRQLQAAGYETAYIGKWHMGEENDDRRPGFDHFVTHRGQGKYFDTEFRINGGERRVIPGYYTTVVTDLALDWLKQKHEKPFLLMLGQKAPHSFYTPEKKNEHLFDQVQVPYPKSAFELDDKPAWFKTRLNTWHGIYGPLFDFRKKFPDSSPEAVKDFEAMTRSYWATIPSVDDSVGRLYEFLRETKQLDNTIIVFAGDNGLLNGEHGMVDKRTMHEPSIRVPQIVRYPKLNPDGKPRVVEKLILHQDTAPSLLELCGAEPLKTAHGKSWVTLIQDANASANKTPWRTSFLYEYNYEKQFPYTPNIRGVRTDRWKYIRYPHGDGSPDKHLGELYDLKNDPQERHNLIADPKQQNQRTELAAELTKLLKETGVEKDEMPLDGGIKSELPDLKIR